MITSQSLALCGRIPGHERTELSMTRRSRPAEPERPFVNLVMKGPAIGSRTRLQLTLSRELSRGHPKSV